VRMLVLDLSYVQDRLSYAHLKLLVLLD